MPRLPRTVLPGVPHHVTQRGNRRQSVFFGDENRRAYLRLLRDYTRKLDVDVLAYCLMDNHVHLVLVPNTEDGLHLALKPIHMRYTQHVNRVHRWSGRLWQGRFFSSPLDESYAWAAIRYVERNPVRAGLTPSAASYRWSSAAAHCGLRVDPALTKKTRWVDWLSGMTEWRAWLDEVDEPEKLDTLRRHVVKGRPCVQTFGDATLSG